jgi:hypothetical protein
MPYPEPFEPKLTELAGFGGLLTVKPRYTSAVSSL